ncbi:MAG: response regulator transcription factor [Dehalococcoidia bacterium]
MNNSSSRVMIVEDSPDYQEILVLTLSLEPYVKIVHIAGSGEEALEVFDEASPELVLLDFKLPGIDGLETAKRMKEQRPDVKIALVTAYAEEILDRATKEANVEEVIPKSSFSLARIQHLLGQK